MEIRVTEEELEEVNPTIQLVSKDIRSTSMTKLFTDIYNQNKNF